MNLKHCKKHKVKFNLETIDKCPLCIEVEKSREENKTKVIFRDKEKLSLSRKSPIVKEKIKKIIELRKKGFSFPIIADILGYADHTTPLYHFYKHQNETRKN